MKGVMANTENSSSSARVKHHSQERLQEKNQVLQEEPLCPGGADCKDFYLNTYSPTASKR